MARNFEQEIIAVGTVEIARLDIPEAEKQAWVDAIAAIELRRNPPKPTFKVWGATLTRRYAKALNDEGSRGLEVWDISGDVQAGDLQMISKAFELNRCQHSYDCCGHWYRSQRPRIYFTRKGAVLVDETYMNV